MSTASDSLSESVQELTLQFEGLCAEGPLKSISHRIFIYLDQFGLDASSIVDQFLTNSTTNHVP